MKRKRDLVTKFRELWKSLTALEREHLWDIMTALRGSDRGDNDDVKYATTARIRGELLGVRYSRGYVFLNLAQAKKEMEYLKAHELGYKSHVVKANFMEKSWHFKQHIKQAIRALDHYRPKTAMRDLQKYLGF